MVLRHNADMARSLARMMARQSRMLRDEGLLPEAREVARRAVLLSRLGWSERLLRRVLAA